MQLRPVKFHDMKCVRRSMACVEFRNTDSEGWNDLSVRCGGSLILRLDAADLLSEPLAPPGGGREESDRNELGRPLCVGI